jgi:hypothetical protein
METRIFRLSKAEQYNCQNCSSNDQAGGCKLAELHNQGRLTVPDAKKAGVDLNRVNWDGCPNGLKRP